ncbi:MAG: nucleotidyltransferase family protein [Desulfobacterium sp.]|nr:nucleotidyltransferase family protein [Desulfobacterium sp.]
MKTHSKNKRLEIILCCASTKLETSQIKRLEKLVKDAVDWQPILDLAIEHGLINFLYYHLKNTCKELVPKNFFILLQRYYFQNSARNLSLSASLIKLVNLLKKNNITVVPFKGPVQAQILYKDPGLRSFSDLDILVKREDAVNARNLLFQNGFTTDIIIPDNQLIKYLAKENFFTLISRSGSIVIDLHWEMTGRYSLYPLYLEDLPGSLENAKLVDINILSLSCEDMLIQLCIHGTSHCWDKLEMVCSVAEIVKSNRIKDWDGIIRRASRFKCRRMIYLGLLLAKHLFDIVLPGEIEASMKNDLRINKLSKRILQNILKEKTAYTESLSWRFSPTHFLVRDNLFDMVHYFFRLLFRPTVREWIKYPLPDSLLFLYYILRPYRLIKDGLRGKNA